MTAQPDSPRPRRRQNVVIGRTFGKSRKGDPPVFSFAPDGDYSAWSLIEIGIQNALRWIYLEDQYLVSRMARQTLLKKLDEPKFEFLLMLMANSNGSDLKYVKTARNEFRKDLKKLDPQQKKWGLYTLNTPPDPARQAWSGNYVHSKTWIFDDAYAIIGSANCNDRGYTLDSEIVAGIVDIDDRDLRVGKSFAIDVRTRLWSKYLVRPHAEVRDFRQRLMHWHKPSPAAMVVEYSGYEDDEGYKPPSPFPPDAAAQSKYEYLWTMFLDPDARSR